MKTTLISLILLISYCNGFTQDIKATYIVKRDVIIDDAKNGFYKVIPIDYTCFFYKKGNKYISYNKPNYLKKYPNGSIVLNINENHTFNYGLNMDTIQNITYHNIDSLVKRYRNSYGFKEKVTENILLEFDINYFQWEILPETKNISGLNCQRAKLSIRQQPQWDLWFCADIPSDVGISSIVGLPGLIVEADHIPVKTKYILQNYELNANINDNIFWPDEFKDPFVIRPRLVRKADSDKPKEKTKILKQAELTNQ
jgi:GLPGLI family protein